MIYATPPPLPAILGVLRKLVFGEKRSNRGANSPGCSQVLIKNRRSSWCVSEKSWSTCALFDKDLTFGRASLILWLTILVAGWMRRDIRLSRLAPPPWVSHRRGDQCCCKLWWRQVNRKKRTRLEYKKKPKAPWTNDGVNTPHQRSNRHKLPRARATPVAATSPAPQPRGTPRWVMSTQLFRNRRQWRWELFKKLSSIGDHWQGCTDVHKRLLLIHKQRVSFCL